MKVKEESAKAGLKPQYSKNWGHGIQSHYFMANRRRKMEKVADLIFLDSKSIVDGDCSHEIKRCLHLERKAMTNLDSVLKSKNITLLAKIHIVKAVVFPVINDRCES